MSDTQRSLDALLDRRRFLKTAGVGALGLAGAGLFPKGALAATAPADMDVAILNFALNLEYLEAEFYAHATTGKGLAALGIPVTGSDGTPAGGVVVKPSGTTQVPFQSQAVEDYALELARDEKHHVVFIQNALKAAGADYVAEPKIDLYNSFKALGSLIGVPNFDPFANDVNFLLGSYIFEDVGVTAYHGAAPLITDKTVLGYAAGILAVEAFHAGIIRTRLYEVSQSTAPSVGGLTQKISDVRLMFGGQSKDSNGNLTDEDYGVELEGESTIVTKDSNGLAFVRTTQQVLNIVYASKSGTPGGFLPNGANGAIK